MHTDTSTRSLIGSSPVPAENFPLPRADMQVTVYMDGFPHAITPADLSSGGRAMVFAFRNADGSYTAKLIRCVTAGNKQGTPGPSASPGA